MSYAEINAFSCCCLVHTLLYNSAEYGVNTQWQYKTICCPDTCGEAATGMPLDVNVLLQTMTKTKLQDMMSMWICNAGTQCDSCILDAVL